MNTNKKILVSDYNQNFSINNKYADYINSYYVTENSLEINSNKTNKSNAIILLLDRLNILKENIHTNDDYMYKRVNSIYKLKK